MIQWIRRLMCSMFGHRIEQSCDWRYEWPTYTENVYVCRRCFVPLITTIANPPA